MSWLIVRTDFAKEQAVATQAENYGYTCYLPMEARYYRQGATRARRTREIPVLPRLLLVKAPYTIQSLYFQTHLASFKHVQGVARDAQGGVFVVPDVQVALFQETVVAWQAAARNAYVKKQTKGRRPKLRSFEGLAEYLSTLAKQDEMCNI